MTGAETPVDSAARLSAVRIAALILRLRGGIAGLRAKGGPKAGFAAHQRRTALGRRQRPRRLGNEHRIRRHVRADVRRTRIGADGAKGESNGRRSQQNDLTYDRFLSTFLSVTYRTLNHARRRRFVVP